MTITSRKTIVSAISEHPFILIKPASKSRIDRGFKLKDIPSKDRLEGSGPLENRVHAPGETGGCE